MCKAKLRIAVLYFVLLALLVPMPGAVAFGQTGKPTATNVASVQVKVLKAANLREGPGTNYEVVGTAKANQAVSIVGKNAKGDWYKLSTGVWIAAFLVSKPVGNVAVVDEVAKAVEPTATVRAKPAATKSVIVGKVTALEQLYLDAASKILGNYTTALDTVGEKFTEAGNRPALLFSDRWKLEVAAAFAMISFSSSVLRELSAPPRLHDVHEKLIEIADHYDLAVTYASEGIDELDLDKLSLAAVEIQTGALLFVEANGLLGEFEALIEN